MALRQIEITVPKENGYMLNEILTDESVIHFWQDKSDSQSGHLLKMLVDASQTEQFLDKTERLLGRVEGFRLVMLPVEATLPRIPEPEAEEKTEEDTPPAQPWEQPLQGIRVSREELYSDILDSIRLSRIFMAMVVLSTIVAALGVLRDNTAVVIGAMVIAPLLGPNVGLALSTVLGDFDLGLKSLKTNLAGLVTALTISILLGFIMHVDTNVYEIAIRTEVHLFDIALALASGAAGVLA